MNSRSMRNVFIYMLILVALVLVVVMVIRPSGGGESRDFSWVIAQAREGNVTTIEVRGDNLKVFLRGQSDPVESRKESSASMHEVLADNNIPIGGPNGVELKVEGPSSFGNIFGLLINFLPLLIFGAILIFLMRQAGGANNQAM